MKRSVWISTTIAAAILMTIATVSASAQFRRPSEREIYQLGQRNGYQQGLREGRQDRQSGYGFDYKRSRAYKDGKWGYRNEYRHDGTYRDGYRNGFAAGYREGYNSGGWGRRDDDRWDRNNRNRRNDPWWDRNNRNGRDDDWRRRY